MDSVKEERSAKKVKLAPPGEPDTLNKIVKQLEYYFSDVNVCRDRFLQEAFKKNDGWVDVSTLLTFVRLKELTKDDNTVVKALQEFESDVIELDAEKKLIRRRKPIPDIAEFQKDLKERTIHISGFPVDYTFEALHRFCSQYGEVESVNMRLHFKTRFFKGCVHAVYKSAEDVKKILALDVLKCKDRDLRREKMEDYYKRKEEYKEKLKKKKHGKDKDCKVATDKECKIEADKGCEVAI